MQSSFTSFFCTTATERFAICNNGSFADFFWSRNSFHSICVRLKHVLATKCQAFPWISTLNKLVLFVDKFFFISRCCLAKNRRLLITSSAEIRSSQIFHTKQITQLFAFVIKPELVLYLVRCNVVIVCEGTQRRWRVSRCKHHEALSFI